MQASPESLGHGQTALRLRPDARAAHLAAVYRIADPALNELALEALLDELLGRVQSVLGVDTVAILLLDEERGELVARAAKGLEEEVRKRAQVPLGAGFAGRVAARRAPIYIADVSAADIVNPILRASGLTALLGVPLLAHGEVLGVMHVGSLAPRVFTDDDALLLQLAAARAAPAIERAILLEDLEEERSAAVTLQRTLLPAVLPQLPGLDVAAAYLPARAVVGGDWYDVLDLDDGRIAVLVGDIAGHGVRAAALMGQLRIGLRAYALEGHPPEVALPMLDRLMRTITRTEIATAAYVLVDPGTGELHAAAAGHPPPLVVGRDARLVPIVAGPPLGAPADRPLPVVTDRLGPGETLVLYTDGLYERRTVPLSTMLDRLRVAAGTAPRGSAQVLVDALLRAMDVLDGAEDDVAIIALRRA